jgi:two-component system cell cycle sensor histidine kinase/response regulator CckA
LVTRNRKFSSGLGNLIRGEDGYMLIRPLFLFIFSIFILIHTGMLFPGNDLAIISVAISFLTWSFLYTIWRTYKYIVKNKRVKLHAELYAMALGDDALAVILVDARARVLDYSLSSTFKSDMQQALATTESLYSFLQLFGIEKSIADNLLDSNQSAAIFAEGLIDLQKVALELSSRAFSLKFNKVEHCFVIKIAKATQAEEVQQLQGMELGSYGLDDSGNITQCNDYFANLLGYSQEELTALGPKLSDLIVNYGAIDRNLNNNFIGGWQGFVTINNRAGEKVYLALVQKLISSMIDSPLQVTGVAIHLNSNNMIMQSKGIESGWLDYSWECFFEQSPYPVVILDLTGKITRYNNAAANVLNNLKVGKKFSGVLTDSFSGLIQDEMSKIKKQGNYNAQPIRNAILESGKQVVDIHVGKINDLSGNIWGFLIRISDVSEKKELEENLSHAQRVQTIGYLSGSIAHDFNNILTAIIGFSEMLLGSHEESDKSYNALYQIRQSALRASNLVQKLLAFSRKQTLKPRVIDVNEILVDIFPMIKRLVGSDIEIGQDIAANLWHVKVDPVQLEQVMLNLVVNAHQAMESRRGEISIRVCNVSVVDKNYLSHYIMPHGEKRAHPGDYVKFEIADTGRGISPSDLQKIFEPFYTTKLDSGTGLGLSTVYGIVKQSGGYIYVNSVRNQGTSFVILLEKFEGKPEKLAFDIAFHNNIPGEGGVLIKDKAAIKNNKRNNIVLLEDEDAVRSFTCQVLKKHGYNVRDYSLPGEALAALEEGDFDVDLIISDVVMPGMSGPELIKKLPKRYAKVEVIFISGYGEDVFNEEYGDSRDFNFMAKPFSMKSLIAMVNSTLR